MPSSPSEAKAEHASSTCCRAVGFDIVAGGVGALLVMCLARLGAKPSSVRALATTVDSLVNLSLDDLQILSWVLTFDGVSDPAYVGPRTPSRMPCPEQGA